MSTNTAGTNPPTLSKAPPINAKRHDLPRVEQMIAKANRDSDRASCFVLGDSLTDNQGAVIVIKGADAFLKLRTYCIREGLLTDGKPVVDPTGRKVSA